MTKSNRGGGINSKIGFVGLLLVWYATVQIAYNSGRQVPMQPEAEILVNKQPLSSTSLAYEQSFGFFDDVTDDDWKMRQMNARKHHHHPGNNPLQYWNKMHTPGQFYNHHYEPLFSCPHLLRVGGPGDGPKWVCDPHRIKKVVAKRKQKCLVYSIGCGGLYLWEDGLYNLLGPDECEFHIFDPGQYDRPTVNAQSNIHYHRWGIKSSYRNDSHSYLYNQSGVTDHTFKTFPESLRLLGHENRTIDLLKVDCEGCEWFSYLDFINFGDARQIMVETHYLPMPKTTSGWPWPGIDLKPTQFFDDLQNAGYIVFSKEPNIHQKIQGNLVEWSFIKLREDFLKGS